MTLKPMFVDKQEAARILSLSESTFEELIRKNEFPKPRLLSSRRVGWLVREVEEWAESRPVADLLPPPNTGSRKGKAKATPTAETTA
jgi:prophage regulatory protein